MTVLIPRTRLYRLEPAGLGTPLVEALSSYVMRLAAAHYLSISALVRAAVPTLMPSDRSRGTPVGELSEAAGLANGMATQAKRWVAELGKATSRSDLASLTLLAWSNLLPATHLLRGTVAHCRLCLEEMAVAGTVYEPLLWALHNVTACPLHQVRLDTHCRHCSATQAPLGIWGRPGICRRCRSWLGGSGSTQATPSERAASQVIAGFLARPPESADPDGLRTSIAGALRESGLTAERYASAAGVSVGSLSGWRRGQIRPSLDGLLGLCTVGSWDPSSFLDGNLVPTRADLDAARNVRVARRRIDWASTADAVLAHLADEPPATLRAVSKDLGIGSGWLRERLPAETSKVIRRWRAWQARKVKAGAAHKRALVVAATLAVLEERGKAPRRLVEARLPPAVRLREPAVREIWSATRRRWAASRAEKSHPRVSGESASRTRLGNRRCIVGIVADDEASLAEAAATFTCFGLSLPSAFGDFDGDRYDDASLTV